MKFSIHKIGAMLVAMMLLMAIVAPLIAPYDPATYDVGKAFAKPTMMHPLGNDADGRDVLSRLIFGARSSLGIALAVLSISLLIGCGAGLLAGFVGGLVDRCFMFVTDVLLAFPSFLLAVAVAAFLTPSVVNVVLVLSLKGWVTYARLTRGQAMSLREREYVLAGKAAGAGLPRLLTKHLLPNMLSSLIVHASFGMAGLILIESSLSFLGLGVPVETPSWGAMIDQGTKYLLMAPRLSIVPGIAIMLTVLGFNLLGEGLRKHFAPWRTA